jgi:hypothetical protein
LAERIEVTRIAWPRPRQEVIALVGEENQSLPLLVLASEAPDVFATGSHGQVRFVTGKDEILSVLSRRHGIPTPHP